MYEQIYGHFGLTRNPFLVSPDPENFYSTAAHDEALLQLVSRIEARQGFLVLTGEAGTGKTIVLRYLLDWLRRYNYPTAYVFHPLLRSADLLELILEDFGVPCHSNTKKDLLVALKNWLIDRRRVGDCPVILIDEAQALKNKTLRQLAALVRLQVDGSRLVQLVLAGQPSLEEKLNDTQLEQLQLRVMYNCKLPALSMAETAGYIGSRLTVAGARVTDTAMFPEDSVEEIFGYSRGIPRVINLLCEHAFLAAYADRRKAISPNDVLRVAQFFDLSGAPKLDKDAVATGTFCRLIPFPHLETAVAEVQTSGSEVISVPAHEIAASCEQAEPAVEGPMAAVSVVEEEPLETDETAVGTLVEMVEEPVPVAVGETRVEDPVLLPEFAASLAQIEAAAHQEQEAFALEPEPVIAAEEDDPALPMPELETIFELASAEPAVPVVPVTEPTVTVLPREPDLQAIEPEPIVLAASVEETVVTLLPVEAVVESVDLPIVEDPVVQHREEVETVEEPVGVASVSLAVAEPVQATVVSEVASTTTDVEVLPVATVPIVVELPLVKPLVKTPVLARVVAFPPPPRVVLVKPHISPTKLAIPRQRTALANLHRGKMRFTQYWRGVGHSLVLDGHAFGRQCSIWLQKPVEKGWISESTYKAFLAVSSWLQQPLHSDPVGRSHPQLPSTSQKHS
jgi:general secretion pathway protein A